MALNERIFKALANRRRLAIVKLLKQRPRVAVGDIASNLKVSMPTTSKHLSILAAADIVDYERMSLSIYYSLVNNPSAMMRDVLKHI